MITRHADCGGGPRMKLHHLWFVYMRLKSEHTRVSFHIARAEYLNESINS